MYVVFILLKALMAAKVLSDYLLNIRNVREGFKLSSTMAINSTFCFSYSFLFFFCFSLLILVSGTLGETETVGEGWPVGLGLGHTAPALTWVSGTMGFAAGEALKKVDRGEEMMIGSGRTKPLRSQLGMEFSSVFITRVSMA